MSDGRGAEEKRPVFGCEAVAERPDGQRRIFTPYPTPLFDDQGRLTGAVNMLVDITERKRAEDILRESEERFRAIVETTPECVKVVAADGTLLLMNEAGLGMVGAAAADEVAGRASTISSRRRTAKPTAASTSASAVAGRARWNSTS